MILELQMIMEQLDYKIMLLLTGLIVLLTIDTIVGIVIAKLNKDVQFTSYKMKTGILVKITEFILCVVAIPFALMVDGGIEFLVLGYFFLCGAEFYSILGNLKIVDDGKEGLTILTGILDKIFKRNGEK